MWIKRPKHFSRVFRLTPLYPKTRAGANGTRINFFLVPAPSGKKVLIELVEAGASA